MLPEEIIKDPFCYLVSFDSEKKTVIFANTSSDLFRKNLWLAPSDFKLESLFSVPIKEAINEIKAPKNPQSINYFFHLPFCGSSLVTNIINKSTTVIRDPDSLYSLFSATSPFKKNTRTYNDLINLTLNLLGRPFFNRKPIVRVAGSNPEMLEPLVKAQSFNSSVFLMDSPQNYLLQVLKDPSRRKGVRILLSRHEEFIKKRSKISLPLLTDAAATTLAWLLVVEKTWEAHRDKADRLKIVIGQRIFANPEAQAKRILKYFKTPYHQLSNRQKMQLLTTHAKTNKKFKPNYDARCNYNTR